MSPLPVRVVKIGGSLLDLPDLPETLEAWLTRQSSAAQVLVGGGGPFVEAVRCASRRFPIDPAVAHWICIDLLTATARLISTFVPSAELILRYDSLLAAVQRPGTVRAVFAVADFLEHVEPLLPGPVLPHAWSVTSDSIAARLASALGASELVLLKSAHAPPGLSTVAAAASGLVDEFFPTASRSLQFVRWVNLRDSQAAESHLSLSSNVAS